MENPQIDILLATYNGGRFLRTQIDSILNQTNSNWRLLIHDDGSIDDTLEIIQNYCVRFPSKIFQISDGIKFGSACRNFGHLLNHSTAKYTMFCDQDDIWNSDKIQKSLQAIASQEARGDGIKCLVYSDLTLIDSEGSIIAKSMRQYQGLPEFGKISTGILLENYITGCTMMINKNLREFVSPLPPQAMIHDWWIAQAAFFVGTISGINEPLVLYRQHSSNDTGAKSYTLTSVLKQLFTHPLCLAKHLMHTQRRIHTQLCALEFLVRHAQHNNAMAFDALTAYINSRSAFTRKLVLIRKRLLSGNAIKICGKLIFY